MTHIMVLTDLDGSLLDAATYSFEPAREALAALRDRHIPLILVSSKTRAEMEAIRLRLDNAHPFVVENGGALYVPAWLGACPIEGATRRDGYRVIELGTPYPVLREALNDIRQTLRSGIRGFGDMSVGEIAERTGLSHAEAVLAKQREYDEPFVLEGIEDQAGAAHELRRLAEARGLRCTRGGRFFHLTGNNDKGLACRRLIDGYRRHVQEVGGSLMTIAIGDSDNDLSMLALADRSVLVQKPDGAYEPDVRFSTRLPNLILAPGIGPVGWNRTLLALLEGAKS